MILFKIILKIFETWCEDFWIFSLKIPCASIDSFSPSPQNFLLVHFFRVYYSILNDTKWEKF